MKNSKLPNSYAEQKAWKEIEATMPNKYHFSDDFKPTEEWWDWNGNKVHLDTFRNLNAPAKVIMVHGVGTNGRQMSMVLGGPLAKLGYETIAIDMPTYGITKVGPKQTIVYDDWIKLGNDYINRELQRDNRPIFLYGLSAGGMETFDIAAMNGKVKGIIGMTFLDQRNEDVRNTTTNNWFWSHIGVPMAKLMSNIGLGKMKIRMSICSKMWALCNNELSMKAFMKDKTSAANSVTYTFIKSYMYHDLVTTPEQFDVCPVLLTQPELDRWTPERLSSPFLARIKKAPVKIVILPQGGHYPVEEQALDKLHEEANRFITSILNK